MLLLSTHTMLSAAIKTPELELSKPEAHEMAVAAANVARHYPTEIDPKMLDWYNLIIAAGLCYGPRFYMIRERLKAERAEKRGRGSTGGGPVAVPDPSFTPTPPPPVYDQAAVFDGPLDLSTIQRGPITGG